MAELDDSLVFTLEHFLGDYFDHFITLESGETFSTLVAQFCLLSWSECFVLPSQRLLAGVISNILLSRIASDLSLWSFLSAKPTFVGSEAFSRGIVFVSILRLVELTLSDHITPVNL